MTKFMLAAASAIALGAAPAQAQLLGNIGGTVSGALNGTLGSTVSGVGSLGHLGGAGLGEGKAEDRGRIDAREQQPQHPRGEDMGLPGPRRGRQRRMNRRIGRERLLVLELGKLFETCAHAASHTAAKAIEVRA